MITEEEVIKAYTDLLGREPSASEIQFQIDTESQRGYGDYYLRLAITNSPEYAEKQARQISEPSPEELELLGLERDIIMQYLEIQGREIERSEATRAAFERLMRGETFEPTTPEEFNAIMAFQSSKVAQKQLQRLSDALEGKIPVSPATQRAAEQARGELTEQYAKQLGPGFGTSSPYIEAKTKLEESIGVREDLERRGIIEGGISPAEASFQFGRRTTTTPLPTSPPSIQSSLSTLAGIREGRLRASLGYRGQNIEREVGLAGLNRRRSRSGAGLGTALGLLGAGAGYYFGGPGGAAAGYGIGTTLGGSMGPYGY